MSDEPVTDTIPLSSPLPKLPTYWAACGCKGTRWIMPYGQKTRPCGICGQTIDYLRHDQP